MREIFALALGVAIGLALLVLFTTAATQGCPS